MKSAPASLSTLVAVLSRAVGLLAPERGVAFAIGTAGAMVAALQVAEPLLFGWAVNELASGGNSFPYVVMWGGASFLSFVAGLTISALADRMAHRRRLAAMGAYVEHVLALPASFHSKAHSGRLMRVMIAGCDTLFNIWLPIFREQLTNVVSLFLLVPIAFYLNWRLSLLLGALMVFYVTVNVLVIRHTSAGQTEVENEFINISGRVSDIVGNVTVLQSFLAVALEMRRIRSSLDRLLAAQYPVLNWWAAMSVLTRGASSISIVSIFAYGSLLVSRGQSSIGEIVSFVGFATLLIGRLDQTTNFIMALFIRAPSLVQFFAVLDQAPDIVEKPDAKPLDVREGHVVYEKVTFRYPPGAGGVTDLSIDAKPGETIAIVGPTGSGKSTAAALLTRAYDPELGRILIDGQDIRDVTLSSLRASIGVVFQEAALFSRSIAENIAIGRPTATMEEIEDVARTAGAYDFIMRKDQGFHTVLGERGQGLSGGERQRIAIARALLKNAPILILDEATSALDVATEVRLQGALDRLREGRTTFIIAHRLSTVRDADRIVVLDAGHIVELGSFDELAMKGGAFAELIRQGGISAARHA